MDPIATRLVEFLPSAAELIVAPLTQRSIEISVIFAASRGGFGSSELGTFQQVPVGV
jgi:hypothetical protein